MTILEKMQLRAEERAERFTPYPLKKWFPLVDLKSLTWIGTFSWSNAESKTRWLQNAVVLDLFGIPQIPPEVARDYLHAKYTEPRRHTINQFKAINEHRAPPLYAEIGEYEDMALIDLKSAYWSITQIVGWDVDYHPGRWLGKRSEMDDFPVPENKIARNSMVSAGLVTHQKIWTGQKLRSVKAHNQFINYDIWSLCQDVLHSLAFIAIKAGAVHIHTDGYIVPMRNIDKLMNEIRFWGLTATIKEIGPAKVFGVGSYDIGDRKTKHRYHYQPRSINKVYEPDIHFLRPRIHKFASTIIIW